MKLKRIVSLALAGVMAVSMLTACGNSNGNGGQVPPEENNAVDGGYSDMLAKYMEDVADLDHVTFQDNSDDVAALKDALGNFGNVVIGGGSLLPYLVCLDGDNTFGIGKDPNGVMNGVLSITNLKNDFAKSLDLADADLAVNDLSLAQKDSLNVTRKDGTIFVIDGSVSLEKVMNQIANGNNYNYKGLKGIFGAGLPENLKDGQLTWHYNYTISASVVNVPATAVDGYNGSVNFIAVTVTRTPV